MKRPRRNHTAVFEAKVALASLRVGGKRDVAASGTSIALLFG